MNIENSILNCLKKHGLSTIRRISEECRKTDKVLRKVLNAMVALGTVRCKRTRTAKRGGAKTCLEYGVIRSKSIVKSDGEQFYVLEVHADGRLHLESRATGNTYDGCEPQHYQLCK